MSEARPRAGAMTRAAFWATGLPACRLAAPLGMLSVALALRYARAPAPAIGALRLVTDLVLFFAHGLVFLFANVIAGLFLLLNARSLRWLVITALPYVGV